MYQRTKPTWKERLYSSYISSSRVNSSQKEPEAVFLLRKAYIQKIIREHFPSDKNIQILDLGCGEGAFIYYLSQAGYNNVYGVDASAEQVALAHACGISQVEQLDINDYLSTAGDESADVVLLMDVLEHFQRQELFDILDEVLRILRPGGEIIAHVPNASGIFGMQVLYGDLTHELAFTPKSAQQLLTTTGFQRVKCCEDKPVVHGIASALRRLIWDCGTIPARILLAAETGGFSAILSRTMLIRAMKPVAIPDRKLNP